MNWKGFGRKLPWPNGGTIFDICLARQVKTTDNLRIAAVLAEIQIDYLLNTYIVGYL
jgi:hypothetical protein